MECQPLQASHRLTATPKITVAADVDLAVTVSPGPVAAKPGEQLIAPALVTNPGPEPVDGAALRLVGQVSDHRLERRQQPRLRPGHRARSDARQRPGDDSARRCGPGRH